MSEDERKLIRGLEALANGDEGAPPEVWSRLHTEFHRKARHHPARWLMVVAATVALALLLSRPTPQPTVPPSPDLSSFVPLDSSPLSAGIVVRVKLPRTTLIAEDGPDDVEADVLLGEDGLAHAVRFIE